MPNDLSSWSDLFAIGTFILAFGGLVYGVRERSITKNRWKKKTRALERYLKKRHKAVEGSDESGQHTIVHLIRHVGLTEDEMLRISFESAHVGRVVTQNDEGQADKILLEYVVGKRKKAMQNAG